VDVDVLKHSLDRWEEKPSAAGVHTRLLCLARARAPLGAGDDVVVAQNLARPGFIEDLPRRRERHSDGFVEFILDIDDAALAERLHGE
jgi:hypothetical protein